MRMQARNILGRIQPEPNDPLYAKRWSSSLPATYSQHLDAPGRPAAHGDYIRSHDGLVGNIRNEDWRWLRRHDYYLNCPARGRLQHQFVARRTRRARPRLEHH